ncbi:MAG: M56 family metallopeptidase [Candidatus Bathyarchaeota archaeon]|nr:M56 family metallopeptidase [Candidatus Bathyarchaeota archaeon]
MTEPIFYSYTPEVPHSFYNKLLDFIHTQYVLPQKHRFVDVSRETTSQGEFLSYVINDMRKKRSIQVEVKSGNPFELKVTPIDPSVTQSTLDEAKQDVLIAMQIFSQNAKNSTVSFAWREGEEIVPEAYMKAKKSFNHFLFEVQLIFFAVFIFLGMTVFLTIATVSPDIFWIAPLILIAFQFGFFFFSNHFIEKSADWQITQANPTIHLLEYFLPDCESDFNKKYSREKLTTIKKEIYKEIIAKQGQVDTEAAGKIFLKHGVPCELENLKVKKVNVYELVKKVADKFGFPVPKIVVSNTMVANAATSGSSPKRGLVLITTGLLAQLQENEILSVLGHEFGHLKGRDPLILYALVSSEFLFRFYVLFPLLPLIFSSFLFFAYFWSVMVLIFFIAKFFEARADLVSAMLVGNPHVLARSLEKIGYQRLLSERAPSYRVQEWIGLDPHPPIYFRVNRLEQLTSEKIKHPLLRSIRDVTNAFIATLKS